MKSFGFWIPILAALVVTPVALLLAIASTGAGHGNYFWAIILFPFTMLSAAAFDSITATFILLATFQFPVYGIILAFAVLRKRLTTVGAVLLTVHFLAVISCFIFGGSNF